MYHKLKEREAKQASELALAEAEARSRPRAPMPQVEEPTRVEHFFTTAPPCAAQLQAGDTIKYNTCGRMWGRSRIQKVTSEGTLVLMDGTAYVASLASAFDHCFLTRLLCSLDSDHVVFKVEVGADSYVVCGAHHTPMTHTMQYCGDSWLPRGRAQTHYK